MVHIYMVTRGDRNRVREFIEHLHSQYFDYRVSPHSEIPPLKMQLAVRPIQLWEIACPKESLNEVLATIGGSEFDPKDNRWACKLMGHLMKLRRVLGLKPIPKIPANTPRRICISDRVDKKLLGIKDDKEGTTELI